MKTYVISFVRQENGYRVWVYGLFPDEATSHFKEKFVGIGNYPLCYSERLIPAITSEWRGHKLVSIVTLMEKFVNDYFPEYQKKAVTPFIPYLTKIMKTILSKGRRSRCMG